MLWSNLRHPRVWLMIGVWVSWKENVISLALFIMKWKKTFWNIMSVGFWWKKKEQVEEILILGRHTQWVLLRWCSCADLQYSGVRPLFMDVEMPLTCRQGEQVGIRVSVFNYMIKDIEVMLVLANSPKYKFIHVEPYGVVASYNPRTSSGEHQHLVWIKSQDVVQVHFPIVATVLGDVEVNIRIVGQIARDEITRTIRVEVMHITHYFYLWAQWKP